MIVLKGVSGRWPGQTPIIQPSPRVQRCSIDERCGMVEIERRNTVATCVGDDARVEHARLAIVEAQEAERARQARAEAEAAEQAASEVQVREIAWIERTKTAVRGALRNPNSARFRNVELYRPFAGRDTPVVCGEVNSENGFGGMTGFQGFIGSGGTVGPFLQEQMAPGEFARSRREMCMNAATEG